MAFGLVRGGRHAATPRHGTRDYRVAAARAGSRLERSPGAPRWGFFLRAETMHGLLHLPRVASTRRPRPPLPRDEPRRVVPRGAAHPLRLARASTASTSPRPRCRSARQIALVAAPARPRRGRVPRSCARPTRRCSRLAPGRHACSRWASTGLRETAWRRPGAGRRTGAQYLDEPAALPAARPRQLGPGTARSRQNSLPSTSCNAARRDSFSSSASSSCAARGAERQQARALGLERGQALRAHEPGADPPHVEVHAVLDDLALGNACWKMRPARARPRGVEAGEGRPLVLRRRGCDVPQHLATRSERRGRVRTQSKVTWNCLIGVIGPPSAPRVTSRSWRTRHRSMSRSASAPNGIRGRPAVRRWVRSRSTQMPRKRTNRTVAERKLLMAVTLLPSLSCHQWQ